MRARHAHPDALSAQAKLTALNLPFMRENYQSPAKTAADKQWSHLNSALLDRLLHHVETVVIEGKSYRGHDHADN